MILIRRPWTRQPQSPKGIDWSNPLTRGLAVCVVPFGLRFIELISNQLSSANNSELIPGSTIDGNHTAALRGEVNTISGFSNPTRMEEITGTADYSVFFEGCPEVNGGARGIIGCVDAYATGYGANFGFDDSVHQTNSLRVNYDYSISSGPSVGDILGADYELHSHRAAIVRASGQRNYYTKGKLANSVADSHSLSSHSARRVYIGTDNGSWGTSGASFALVLVWNRAIYASEYAALWNNPWQIFGSRQIIIPTPTAAGYTHPTLSNARMGSLTSTTGVPLVDYAF